MHVFILILNFVPWFNVVHTHSQSLGNNPAHYNKQVLEFSIKNQQRWRGNLGEKPYNSYNTVVVETLM